MPLFNKVILALFAVFLLVICHLWFVGYGIVGLGIQQNNLAWLFVGLVIGASFFLVSREQKLIVPAFWWQGGVAIIVVLIPFIVGSNAYIDQGYLLPLGLVLGWLFLLSMIQFELFRNKPELLALLVLACITIQVIWGFLETFHGVMINLTYDKLLVDPAALGVFNQRNTFGSFLATGLALSLFVFTKYNYDNLKVQKASYYWHLVFVLLAVFTLVFSNSRAAYIGSIVGLLLVLPYSFKVDKKKTISWILCGSVSLITALVLLNITGRVEKELTEGGARIGFYISSFYAILDAPVFGHGLGSFQQVFLEKFAELYYSGQLPEGSSHGNLAHPHNELLLWGVEGGFTAILGLLGFVMVLLRSLWEKSLRFMGVIGILSPIVVHSMVEMPFFQSALHLIVLTLLFIYGYHLVDGKTKDKVYAVKKTTILPLVGGMIGVSSLVVFSLNIASLNKLNSFIQDEDRQLSTIRSAYLSLGWENTYYHMYYGSLSQLGIKNNRPELSQPYIEWAEQTLKVAPKSDYFISLTYAYENVGEIDKAFNTVSTLDYYYPTKFGVQTWIDNFYKHMESKGFRKEDYSQ